MSPVTVASMVRPISSSECRLMAMMMVMKSFKKADLSDHKDLKNARVSAMDESESLC